MSKTLVSVALGCGVLAWLGLAASAPEPKFTVVYNVNGAGYIGVCGCKHKEVRQGSLTRRASFLRQLRGSGKDLLLIDGGSSLFPIEDRVKEDELDAKLRDARLIVESYNRMGYHAMAIGTFDLAAGLENLKELSKRARFPFLSANLIDAKTKEPYFRPHEIIEIAGARIGLIGLTQPTMGEFYLEKVAPGASLSDPIDATRKSLAALKDKVDFVIVLSHLREESTFSLVDAVPGIEAVLDPFIQYGNHHTWIKEDDWIAYRGDTLILRGDGQGARLGVLDVTIKKPRASLASEDRLLEIRELASQGDLDADVQEELRGFDGKNLFSFRVISLEPHLGRDAEIDRLTAASEAKGDPSEVPPLKDPLADRTDFLTADGCKDCHSKQHEFWLTTRHADALASLVQTGDDAAYDCLGCHTLGYGSTFLQPAEVGDYANVQCESCHGTSPQHAKTPEDARFPRITRMTCVTCHNKEVLGDENPFDFAATLPKVKCPKD